ncbi:NFX1-type zinc finger-containing protein 1-like [Folsomia candida]|uniref:NFX1-type zinc finger-containing protein 1-like n=1 Tax=Folsomia candida TaxID=158441 RepID=UPI001604EA51|nr:NFX1-type zinc finger-containing protein 1-like [Folsomia candida]
MSEDAYVPPQRRRGAAQKQEQNDHSIRGQGSRGRSSWVSRNPQSPSSSHSWGDRGGSRGRGRGTGGFGRGRPNTDPERDGPSFSTPRKRIDVPSDGKNGDVTVRNRDVTYQNNSRRPILGFRWVEGLLLEKDNDKCIMTIAREGEEWTKFLESDPIISTRRAGDDGLLLRMVMFLLGRKVCSEQVLLTSDQTTIIVATLNAQKFLDKIRQKLGDLLISGFGASSERGTISEKNSETGLDTTTKGFIQDVFNFCSFTTKRMPESARDFLKNTVLTAAYGLVMAIKGVDPSVAEFEVPLKELILQLDTLSKREEVKQVLKTRRGSTEEQWKYLDDMEPPCNYREMTIVPSMQELMRERREDVFLRRNKTRGAYASPLDYLDIQFRLMREDFVSPLRSGVQEFLRHPMEYSQGRKKMPLGSIRIYNNVQILGSELLRGVTHFWLRLPEKFTRKVKWDRSKRLLPGSLLVLTKDAFKTGSFGVVGIRDADKLKKSGELSFIPEGDPPSYNDTDNFMLIESEVYFEAYRYVLKTLQNLELGDFPMAKFLVDASSEILAPRYLANNETDNEQKKMKLVIPSKEEDDYIADLLTKLLKINHPPKEEEEGIMTINPLIETDWPSGDTLGLDENQYAGFQAAIMKEFVIIEGPPGTGKTYLGLKIAETLLKNHDLWMSQKSAHSEKIGPIVVVCYTNHALDQFLEGIAEILEQQGKKKTREFVRDCTTSIVRLGSRSKSEKLKEFELSNVRNRGGWRESQAEYDLRTRARQAVQNWGCQVDYLKEQYNELKEMKGILDFRCLAVWDSVRPEFPPCLWGLFESLEFFEFNDALLSHRNFDATALVNSWFGRNPNSKLPKKTPDLKLEVEEDDQLEKEDYDLEELLSTRMVDDYQRREFIASNKHGDPHVLTFLDNLSLMDCKKRRSKLEAELMTALEKHNIQINIGTDQEVNDQTIQFIRMRQVLNENRINLLQNILPRLRGMKIDKEAVHETLKEMWGSQKPWRKIFPSVISRWEAYLVVIERSKELLNERRKELEPELIIAERRSAQIRKYGDSQILKHCKVVGMTTTGAGKHYDILQNLNSKIVIVEEAAEVQESHIATCLTKSCQHLILIGDHHQLKPSTTVYELSKKYNLDVSLFERMINNKLQSYKLKEQHRMRPEIADLVRGTIYPELTDATSVLSYPDILGMTQNMFFISHKELENCEADSMSKSNEFEADYLFGLCRYLIHQGYSPSQITVLATYTGQMFLLKGKFRGMDATSGVRITCVDNFQGEENDIILLSLVRSNEDGAVGFLKVENRVCVALSRAKLGMYIAGNMDMLSQGSKIWPQIKEKLGPGRLGDGLPIICRNHGTVEKISRGVDFHTRAPRGGCTRLCESDLQLCNHKCTYVCHIEDPSHTNFKCLENCEKTCPEDEAHPCRDRCHIMPCTPCRYDFTLRLMCGHEKIVLCRDRWEEQICSVKVQKILACGHVTASIPCFTDESKIQCEELVEKMPPCNLHITQMACYINADEFKCQVEEVKLLPCRHTKGLKCHEDETEIRCKTQIIKSLPCGHEQMDVCHLSVDEVKCHNQVKKVLPCKHEVTILCKDKDNERLKNICRNKCTIRLDCGHACTKMCHAEDDPDHKNYQCKKECARACKSGHKCATMHACFKKCPVCTVPEKKNLPCGHSAKLSCHVDPASYKNCKHVCERILPCGHKCDKNCGESCGPCQVPTPHTVPICGHVNVFSCSEIPDQAKCKTLVKSKNRSPCSHAVYVPCNVANTLSSDEVLAHCSQKCGYTFPETDGGCGHKCSGTCGTCSGGRFHVKCDSPCGRLLVCGHVCEFPCSSECPPCSKPCGMKCEHSECSKSCGRPCSVCREPCSWKCPHKACTKLCGEQCDRTPCDEPCSKILAKCGHPCIGYCGEPCPPLCRECDLNELLEFQLLYTEDEPDSRFVWLPDCGHCYEALGFEKFLTVKTNGGDGDDEIVVKRCPRCQTVIRNCRRFGNILHKIFSEVREVSEKIYGNLKDLQTYQAVLLKIISKPKWFTHVPEQMREYVVNLLTENLHKTGTSRMYVRESPRILKSIDSHLLNSLAIIVQVGDKLSRSLKNMEKNLTDKDPMLIKFMRKCNRLYDQLIHHRKLPLSRFEITNLEQEMIRIIDCSKLYRFHQYKSRDEVGIVYDRVDIILESCRPYTGESQKRCLEWLKKLEDICQTGLGISDGERIKILGALGMGKGHWFKCRNGHIYSIGDCGGAMETGKCNECGAAIGGQSHALLADNTLATEMDAATAPAWPTALRQ